MPKNVGGKLAHIGAKGPKVAGAPTTPWLPRTCVFDLRTGSCSGVGLFCSTVSPMWFTYDMSSQCNF